MCIPCPPDRIGQGELLLPQLPAGALHEDAPIAGNACAPPYWAKIITNPVSMSKHKFSNLPTFLRVPTPPLRRVLTTMNPFIGSAQQRPLDLFYPDIEAKATLKTLRLGGDPRTARTANRHRVPWNPQRRFNTAHIIGRSANATDQTSRLANLLSRQPTMLTPDPDSPPRPPAQTHWRTAITGPRRRSPAGPCGARL